MKSGRVFSPRLQKKKNKNEICFFLMEVKSPFHPSTLPLFVFCIKENNVLYYKWKV